MQDSLGGQVQEALEQLEEDALDLSRSELVLHRALETSEVELTIVKHHVD